MTKDTNTNGEKILNASDEFSDFLLYTTPDGDVKVDVFLYEENLRLTQDRMANIFGVGRTAITKHLKNIYDENELQETATCAKMAQVQREGEREVKRDLMYYNLDAIVAVGYRVNSLKATQFRVRATQKLRSFIIKGFAIDDERMKNGQHFGKDYFQELLERVRSIRTSERRIYQQITDIFAECSIDYDRESPITRDFYSTIQNKFHFAISGQTAAEIIYHTADKDKPFMGLQSGKHIPGGRVLKSDTTVAKNYLDEKKIKKLERTIVSYFDYIENQIEMKNVFSMGELAVSINKFLEFNDFEVLVGKGKISKDQAKQKAHAEYDEFNKTQKIVSDFDKEVQKALDRKDG